MVMASSVLINSLVLVAAVVVSFATTSLATSRGPLVKNVDQRPVGFKVMLKHIDSGKNFTRLERLQRAVTRGQHRMNRLSKMVLAADSDSASTEMEAESPIHSGSGEFLMQLSIGTPAESFMAIMDTGSDLIWTQCKPCSQCYDQPTPIFDPRKSSSFAALSCSSGLCRALPSSMCDAGGCGYLYTYGDYSSTQGLMATETFTFGGDGQAVAIPKVGFGCGQDNEGSGFSQGSGLVGLGRGPLSLVSQLGVPEFSYCLTSIDDSKSSKLLIGAQATATNTTSTSALGAIMTVPLIKNPLQPSFYYLPLQGISVGETRLPIKKSTFYIQRDGTGGVIIDSGTTITYLEQSAYDLVTDAFASQMKLPVDKSGTAGLDLCFTLPSGAAQVEVPKLVFHFDGADLDLPGENYMIADATSGVMCLAMGGSSGMSIFGNVQQQNLMVAHDLAKETLSFIPTQCDRL